MKTVLWIAPNLNHYKARFLDRLALESGWEIIVLAGGKMPQDGHRQDEEKRRFKKIGLQTTKKNFHYSLQVYLTVAKLLTQKKFSYVLMPLEKKFLVVVLFLWFLKFFYRYELVSYNHPTVKIKNRKKSIEKLISKVLFLLYDKIIFYTAQSRDWAVSNDLLPPGKALFANNTLDTDLIWQHYDFTINTSPAKTLLFIGRLIPTKGLDVLFTYYQELKHTLPNLRLIIIGDGPLAPLVKKKAQEDTNILWRGAVVNEKKIARDMRQAHIVFHPGASGLTIVHAFCYGKPYVTLKKCKLHGPELAYLEDRKNGILLEGKMQEDLQEISSLLLDNKQYELMCRNAIATARNLSIYNWCQDIVKSFETAVRQT